MRRQSSISFVGVNSGTPANEKLCGKYLQTFAYVTIKDRLPVIITKIVDHLSRDKDDIIAKFGKKAEEDIKLAIGQLSKLKNEVQTNKPLLSIEDDGNDAKDWNDYLVWLEKCEESVCWFQSPWLYTENYLYRRIHQIFRTSSSLQGFDPFHKQKEEAYEAATREMVAVSEALSGEEDVEKKLTHAIKISLWGNRCDLSLSNGVVESQDSTLFKNIDLLDPLVLADDSKKLLDALKSNSSKVIDIVHDNASFELYCDLCLADQLLTLGLAEKIRLRVKSMPWYVSDVIKPDIYWLLEQLPGINLGSLAKRWNDNLNSGRFVITEDKYWTLPFPYSEMKERDPKLYSSLSEAALIIFKGDLNYRKLLGDINWGFSTPFSVALQGFCPSNVLALRTVKADVICGLEPGKTESLFQKEPLWMRTGEYAVIQLSTSV